MKWGQSTWHKIYLDIILYPLYLTYVIRQYPPFFVTRMDTTGCDIEINRSPPWVTITTAPVNPGPKQGVPVFCFDGQFAICRDSKNAAAFAASGNGSSFRPNRNPFSIWMHWQMLPSWMPMSRMAYLNMSSAAPRLHFAGKIGSFISTALATGLPTSATAVSSMGWRMSTRSACPFRRMVAPAFQNKAERRSSPGAEISSTVALPWGNSSDKRTIFKSPIETCQPLWGQTPSIPGINFPLAL